MDILAVNGSQRTDGNTAYALRYALERFERAGFSTSYVSMAGLTVRPCRGCFSCRDGACVHDDDAGQILESMNSAKGIVLGSPVYMGLVTGSMKTLMDRSVALRVRGFQLSGKVGGGVSCGGFRNGGQELTLQCMHTYFLQQDMVVVADGPRFSHSGAAIVGKAAEDAVGLETVCNLVDRMSRALRDRQGSST